MKRISLFLVLLGLPLGTAPAGQSRAGASVEARVDAIFAPWARTSSPGCALAVIRDGDIIYSRGYGMANMEHDIAISPSSVFYVGSVSKQFVTMSIALLAEEGRLSFDDDIRKYVSEIPEYDRPITIRHMIHHTSGLRDYLTLLDLSGRSFADSIFEEEVIDLIARQKELNFVPGDQYLYSNSGYFLLAVIVKRVSGKSLREYAEEKIFAPLGMRNSHFHDDPSGLVTNRAEGHLAQENGGWGLTRSRFALVGSGGLFTTVEDLYRWDQNFYDNRLGKGSPSLLSTMLTRGRLNDGEELGYALGLRIGGYRGLETVSHGGALGGYRAHLLRFPKARFSVAIACNLDDINPGSLANQVADIYLADRLKEPEREVAQAPIPSVLRSAYDDYVGKYEVQPGSVITVRKEGERLLTRLLDGDEEELVPVSDDRFAVEGLSGEFSFEKDAMGNVVAMLLHDEGETRTAKRIPEEPVAPYDLEAYAGEYKSDELLVTYRFFMEEGDLFVQIRRNPKALLHLLAKDVLYRPGVRMTFQRDESGQVSGFKLDAGRVRNLRFVKEER